MGLTELYNQIADSDEELQKEAAEQEKLAAEEEAAGRITARGFMDELQKLAAPATRAPVPVTSPLTAADIADSKKGQQRSKMVPGSKSHINWLKQPVDKRGPRPSFTVQPKPRKLPAVTSGIGPIKVTSGAAKARYRRDMRAAGSRANAQNPVSSAKRTWAGVKSLAAKSWKNL